MIFLKEFNRIFDSNFSKKEKRIDKIQSLIEKKNLIIENFEDFQFYLIKEKLGYNISLSHYVNSLTKRIMFYNKNGIRRDNIDFNIKELGINNIIITMKYNINTSIIRNDNTINIDIPLPFEYSYDELNEMITHELHHIFINHMGNKTNYKYFIINDLIQITNGRTKALLTLYYMAFKDEISSNIQMFHKKIKTNNIKTKEEFIHFLKNDRFCFVIEKMGSLNIKEYWNFIKQENNSQLLIDKLNLNKDNIENELIKIEKFIKKSYNIYKEKINKVFL